MTNSDKPMPQAPPGYKYHQSLFEDFETRHNYPFWVLLIWANFIALIPLGLGLIFLWLPYQFYRLLGTPFAMLPDLNLNVPWLIGLGIVIIFGSMLLHEWLHGLALSALGYKPHYAFNKYYLLATIEAGTYLTRHHYLIMTLTPITVMTIGGALLLPFLPPVIGQIVLIALLLNLAASLGDMMVTQRVYKAPKAALFADDNGIQMFLPATAVASNKNAPTLPEGVST